MGKKVIITGATGMVGKAALLECLEHDDIDEILVLGRSLVGLNSPKLKELLITNFLNYNGYKELLKTYDAAFLCMGTSAAGMSEVKYTEITYTYTMTLAKCFVELNPNATLVYVSGMGTDSTERGRLMWARVKGKTENELLALGVKAYMFRIGAIIPLKGIKSRTRLYQFVYDYFMWVVKLYKYVSPLAVVNTTEIGQAMINAAMYGYEKSILKPKDIMALAKM